MSAHAELITPEQARATIVAALRPTVVERRTLLTATGHVLAEPVVAPSDVPAFDNSAMDGFAFAMSSGPLNIVGESAAGAPYTSRVEAGCAVRIMTGAALPDGCDTVAMREVCSVDGAQLNVDWTAVRRGDHIRRRGAFMQAGGRVLDVGTVLTPSDIGLLASFGRTSALVRAAPRVAIVTSGTELVEPGSLSGGLGGGQIYNSNAYMLHALLAAYGAQPTMLPTVPDDLAAVRAVLQEAASAADLVITVGGVSVGEYDFVREALLADAAPMRFWRVRVKPGKPLAFGMLGATGVLGLPGNPVSAFVAFHLFVRPALAALCGAAFVDRTVVVPCRGDLDSTAARTEYIPGYLEDGEFVANRDRSSGNVLLMRGCDALAVVDEGVATVASGSAVSLVLL